MPAMWRALSWFKYTITVNIYHHGIGPLPTVKGWGTLPKSEESLNMEL